MIVYRNQPRIVSTRDAVAAICEQTSARDHEQIRDLVIGYGRFECGLADANYVQSAELRRIALLLGRIFYRSARVLPVDEFMCDVLRRIGALADLPEQIEIRDPEGYAFYGLFPETYLDATAEFIAELHPREAVCIGIRSIGTSLSAVVAGTLTELGAHVETFTVRPHGHPFDRVTHLPTQTTRQPTQAMNNVPHLIVDEGPGLSGSSIASVAEALSNAGVPDSQIIFFPNWRPDSAALLSEKARARWNRHRIFTEPLDVQSLGMREWRDVSAGQWRELVFQNEFEYPAAHPHHERRKFLSPCEPHILAKFAGFGSRGRACLERSRELHQAGFIPAPLEFANGFLFSKFVPGRPVSKMSPDLMRTIVRYLACLRNTRPLRSSGCQTDLLQMMTVNVSEALGEQWDPPRDLVDGLPDEPRLLDARMLAHEWIETASGFLKTDAVDHADDHFFPGPADIAWDLAGAAIEFSLTDPAPLLDSYASLTGDRGIYRRYRFYALAYSAFRLGYCRLAQTALTGPDYDRFAKAETRYLASIRRYIGPID